MVFQTSDADAVIGTCWPAKPLATVEMVPSGLAKMTWGSVRCRRVRRARFRSVGDACFPATQCEVPICRVASRGGVVRVMIDVNWVSSASISSARTQSRQDRVRNVVVLIASSVAFTDSNDGTVAEVYACTHCVLFKGRSDLCNVWGAVVIRSVAS